MFLVKTGNAPPGTIATVGRVEIDPDGRHLEMPRYDPVNYILDKIDFELYSAERVENNFFLPCLLIFFNVRYQSSIVNFSVNPKKY